MSDAPGVAATPLSLERGPGRSPSSPVWDAMEALGHNVHLVSVDTASNLGAGAGFVLSLLSKPKDSGFIVWVSQSISSTEGGVLYGPGLANYGIDPEKLIYVEATSLKNVFWCIEEALKVSSIRAIVGEFHTSKSLDLTLTRRLALRAKRTGVPIYLLAANSAPFASAAQTHWRVCAATHGKNAQPQAYVGPPTWSLSLDKNRSGPCGTASIGFNAHAGTHFVPTTKRLAPTPTKSAPAVETAGTSLEPIVVHLAAERRKAALHERVRR